MKPSFLNPFVRALPGILVVLVLTGCITQLKAVVRPDTPGAYAPVAAAAVDNAVQVYRAGVRQPDPLKLPLKTGDEIQTGADASALLRFADGNKAIIGPATRVRLGSLEVLFGRVFARVRGRFSTESDTVRADVEGTEYLFVRGPAQAVQVLVLDGVVRCQSKQERWAPQRVAAGQLFQIGYDTRATPQVGPAPPALLDETRRWVDAVDATATPAFKLPFTIGIGIGIGGGGGDRPERSTPVYRE